jgi:hypothetical protein
MSKSGFNEANGLGKGSNIFRALGHLVEPLPWVAYFFFGLTAYSSLLAQTNQSPLDSTQLAQSSTFVFKGTVQTVNATTVSQSPASPSTVIVRVDSIQRCSTNVCGTVGQTVTVRLLEPGSVKEGEQATFFTEGWLLGAGVAVLEIKHVSPAMDDGAVTALLATGSKTINDQALSIQVNLAACVITGQVQQVKPSEMSDRPSEHEKADWQDATIKVLTVEKKGCQISKNNTIEVLFPSSKDIKWVASPRFHEGQTGIWILNPGPNGKFKAGNAPSGKAYSSLGSGDFKSLDELAAVKSAMQKSRVQ